MWVRAAGKEGRRKGRKGGVYAPATFTLNELLGRTHLLAIGRQPRQLRHLLVDYPDLGRQLLLVDVACEELTDIACVGEAIGVLKVSWSLQIGVVEINGDFFFFFCLFITRMRPM